LDFSKLTFKESFCTSDVILDKVEVMLSKFKIPQDRIPKLYKLCSPELLELQVESSLWEDHSPNGASADNTSYRHDGVAKHTDRFYNVLNLFYVISSLADQIDFDEDLNENYTNELNDEVKNEILHDSTINHEETWNPSLKEIVRGGFLARQDLQISAEESIIDFATFNKQYDYVVYTHDKYVNAKPVTWISNDLTNRSSANLKYDSTGIHKYPAGINNITVTTINETVDHGFKGCQGGFTHNWIDRPGVYINNVYTPITRKKPIKRQPTYEDIALEIGPEFDRLLFLSGFIFSDITNIFTDTLPSIDEINEIYNDNLTDQVDVNDTIENTISTSDAFIEQFTFDGYTHVHNGWVRHKPKVPIGYRIHRPNDPLCVKHGSPVWFSGIYHDSNYIHKDPTNSYNGTFLHGPDVTIPNTNLHKGTSGDFIKGVILEDGLTHNWSSEHNSHGNHNGQSTLKAGEDYLWRSLF